MNGDPPELPGLPDLSDLSEGDPIRDVDSEGVYYLSVQDFERRPPATERVAPRRRADAMHASPTPARRIGFWRELLSRLGPPILAATLVACLLAGRFEAIHGVLMAVGIALSAAGRVRS